jgi:hypothetical protein
MDNTSQWNLEKLLHSPIFEPLHSALQQLLSADFPELTDFNELLTKQAPILLQSGKQLVFVEQGIGKLGFESQYEPQCFLSGEVQTRENNYHDLFNALVWLRFPRSKAAINALHFHTLTAATNLACCEFGSDLSNTQRGRTRDMATLFDESGVIIACANSDFAKLLNDFNWKELFWTCRDDLKTQMGFYVFGHGLYEKAINPYTGMTGQGLVLPVKDEFFTWNLLRRIQYLDEKVAAYLDDPSHCLDTRELTPVPLLGIPGWAAENERPEYYDNEKYFRPGRRER